MSFSAMKLNQISAMGLLMSEKKLSESMADDLRHHLCNDLCVVMGGIRSALKDKNISERSRQKLETSLNRSIKMGEYLKKIEEFIDSA